LYKIVNIPEGVELHIQMENMWGSKGLLNLI